MFSAGSWAQAFINSLDNPPKNDDSIDEGFETLKVLASFVKSLPGQVSGKSASEKLETLIRRGMAETAPLASAPTFEAASPALEAAVRFIVLSVRKDRFRYIDLVIEKIKNLIDKKRGIITASLECAFLPGVDESNKTSIEESDIEESRLIEVIKKRTGAAGVELSKRLNPQLIGGYRLRIGDEVIDASIRSQLRELLAVMQNGETSLAGNGGY